MANNCHEKANKCREWKLGVCRQIQKINYAIEIVDLRRKACTAMYKCELIRVLHFSFYMSFQNI